MKKVIIIILTVLVVVLGAGALYWKSLQEETIASEPFDAIPESAAIIITYPDLKRSWTSFKEQEYFQLLSESELLSEFFLQNQLLDSLVDINTEVKDVFAESVIWTSYHPGQSDTVGILHVIRNKAGDDKTLRLLNNAFNGSDAVNAPNLGNSKLLKLRSASSGKTLYCAVANQLTIIGSSHQIVTASIEQLKNGFSIAKQTGFIEAMKVAGNNVEANLYINYTQLPAFLSAYLKPMLVSEGSAIGAFANWSVLDVNLKPDGFAFNGFTYTEDSLKQGLSLFLDQQPQQIRFPEILPQSTASFTFYGIDDFISFSAAYKEFLSGSNRLETLESKLDSINRLYDIEIESNVMSWMGSTFGICITEPNTVTFGDNSYLVLETRSEELASKLLPDLAMTVAKKKGASPESIEVNGIRIESLLLDDLLSDLFGEELTAFSNPAYMILDGYVIFGESTESLTLYLQSVQADRTLAKQLSFSRFIENLGSTFNIFSYHHLQRSQKIFESYLNSETSDLVKDNKKLLENFEAIGSQLTTTGSSFYSNVFLKYNPGQAVSNESVWSAVLDTLPATTPVFVTNHVSGESEILVQDRNNALYLFNSTGQRLFKTALKEKILSKPVQVDAFKNGKLQYVFNTENLIYLIDREGDIVDGYPIELKASAETELAVFDYDNDKDYRLLISCSNKRIYNYGIDGKKVSGWRHNRAADPTIHTFQHFMVSGKDYIVTGESNGKIHLLDRTGKNRVTVEKRVESSKNNQLEVFKSNEPAFTGVYLTDKEGLIHRVALDGDVSTMNIGKFSPEHYFKVTDLNNDGKPEFIFSDLNVLQVFDYKKEKRFEKRLAPSATPPFLINLGNNRKAIGYCFKDTEQLVLYDYSGSMAEGFPMAGISEFDLDKSNQGKLLTSVGAGNTVLIQKLD